jgi:hypothetical protein
LLFFIADLNSARREEANEISSAGCLFLFALLCINRQVLVLVIGYSCFLYTCFSSFAVANGRALAPPIPLLVLKFIVHVADGLNTALEIKNALGGLSGIKYRDRPG